MNIKLASQFILSITAPLTGVIITTAGVAALLGPIWAIVGNMAALPIEIILTRDAATLRLPFSITCLGAETALGGPRLLDSKFLAALRAFQRHAVLQIRAFTSDFWPGDTFFDASKVFAKTLLRAKASLATFLTNDFYTTLFTKHRRQFDYAKIVLGIDSSATLTGAVFARPMAIIPELLAALRADCPDVSRLAIALARAIGLDATRPFISGGVI